MGCHPVPVSTGVLIELSGARYAITPQIKARLDDNVVLIDMTRKYGDQKCAGGPCRYVKRAP